MSNSKSQIGSFISVEGGDGAGKTTQIEHIKAFLQKKGHNVIITREPGGTPLGEKLRPILLDQEEDIVPEAELLMMYAARIQHVENIIKPALAAGKWVISDRFSDSSFAYQGASGVGIAKITSLNNWALGSFAPDLTLYLDVDLETGKKRVIQSEGDPDRFETEGDDYKKRVREIYLSASAIFPDRIKVVDASRDIDNVNGQIYLILNDFFFKLLHS